MASSLKRGACRQLAQLATGPSMAAYRTTAEPNLWFAGAVSETPSEARLRRGEEYLQLRQEKREAHERTRHPASGMPGGGVVQRHSSRREEEVAAARVVVGGGAGGGSGGSGGSGGEHLGLADHAAASRQRAESCLLGALHRPLGADVAALPRGSARRDEAAAAAVPPPPPDPEAHVLLTGAQLAWLAQQLLRAPPTQRDALRRRLPCGMEEEGWRCVPLALLDATGVCRRTPLPTLALTRTLTHLHPSPPPLPSNLALALSPTLSRLMTACNCTCTCACACR